MTAKKQQTQLKVRGADYEYLTAVQEALGLNSTQTLSFILKHSKRCISRKLKNLMSDDLINN